MNKFLLGVFVFLQTTFITLSIVVGLLTQVAGYAFLFVILFCVSFFATYIFFGKTTQKYPLNILSDYEFKIQNDKIGEIEDDTLIIKLCEKEKGIWIVASSEKLLVFDLKGYFFEKLYLAAYFIRNYNYLEINKQKKNLLYSLGKSFHLSHLKRKPYKNVKIVYTTIKNKQKERFIVRNGKTRPNFMIREIIWAIYYADLLDRRWGNANYLKKYEKMDEKKYITLAGLDDKKPSIKDKFK